MFKRFLPALAALLVVSVMLVACGDETAAVPTYTGATSVTVPTDFSTQISSGLQSSKLKNAKIEAYKTSDDATKVKSGLVDGFSKGGWNDATSTLLGASGGDALKAFDQTGGFILGYETGNKAAAVMAFPGQLASAVGFQDVGDKDVVYLVMSGNG
jgi:ABC-type uncharacterized transport system auxiliary subunit